MRVMQRIYGRYWKLVSRRMGRLWLRSRGVLIGTSPVLYGLPIIEVVRGAKISIGQHAVLCSLSTHTSLGVAHRVIIRAMRSGSVIEIGNDVGMSGATLCANTRIRIGDGCLLGADVMICDTDFHPIEGLDRRYARDGIRSAPVEIGNNVFIGARVVVLKGVSIGNNSVIGAGSVVVSAIPENVIAAGNPCKIIKHLASSI